MGIKVIVELLVKQEKIGQVSPLFSVLLKDTRSREGNEGVLIYADQDKPTTFILIQQWVSRDHYEQYNKWRSERGDYIKLAELLAEPPRRRYFDYIDV
tara:strand:+ start:7971 stop:8264 length:294 start_codon:yes stop_codon:yes gene_type:complete